MTAESQTADSSGTLDAASERLAVLESQLADAQRLIMDLEERDALKTQFLSNISHDLRTPLTAIITHAEILRDGILGQVTSKQSESISTIITGGRQLLDMIAEPDAGALQADIANIDSLVEAQIRKFSEGRDSISQILESDVERLAASRATAEAVG